MKIKICYFSGTGNTKWIADNLQKKLTDKNNDVQLFNLAKQEIPDAKEDEFLIIGTPVHAETAPKVVTDFIKELPEASGLKCAVYSTQGGNTSALPAYIAKKLRAKGYDVIVEAFIKMPNNYYFMTKKEYKGESVDKILNAAEVRVKRMADDIVDLRKDLEPIGFFRIPFVGLGNKILGSYVKSASKNMSVTEKCIGCGLCVRSCPKGNITLEDGQANLHSNCIMCLRCIHICPRNAIYFKGRRIDQIQKPIIKNLNLR